MLSLTSPSNKCFYCLDNYEESSNPMNKLIGIRPAEDPNGNQTCFKCYNNQVWKYIQKASKCFTCEEKFDSRSKLHKHLKNNENHRAGGDTGVLLSPGATAISP